MAVWNSVNASFAQESGRTDAEYFKPSYLAALKRLSLCKSERISTLATITDGIHESPVIAEIGIRYISAKCIKDNEISLDGCIRISHRQNDANPRTQLRKDDLIITTVGTIGNVAVVTEEITPSNCDRHVGIIRIIDPNTLPPFYLSTFLNSKYGTFQSFRESAGNVQLSLYVRNIGNILVPRLGDAEFDIERIAKTAYTRRVESEIAFAKAKQLLEGELGLEKLPSRKSVSYTAQACDLARSRRTDAEYYNPMALEIVRRITALQHTAVLESFSVQGGFPWNSTRFLPDNSGEPVVRIRNIKPNHIVPDELTSIDSAYANSVAVPKARGGDVVVGMDGIKYFYASILDGECYVNQRVCHLSPRPNKSMSSEYAVFIINSIVGQAQLMRAMTVAATVGHITNRDVGKLVIPTFSRAFHDKVTELIRESIDSKEESKRLLNQAKTRVEQLIESAVQP